MYSCISLGSFEAITFVESSTYCVMWWNMLDMLNGRVLPISGAMICEPTSLCRSGISLQYSTYKMEESLLPCSTEQFMDVRVSEVNPSISTYCVLLDNMDWMRNFSFPSIP